MKKHRDQKLISILFLLLITGGGLSFFYFFKNQNEAVTIVTLDPSTSPASFSALNKRSSPSSFLSSKPETLVVKKIIFDVPFTPQAPMAEWNDPRQQDGCEEAAALMAVAWARREKIGSRAEAKEKILAVSRWQTERYSSANDTSAHDTVVRLFNGYFNFFGAQAKKTTQPAGILKELAANHLLVVPIDGQRLANPHYTSPGPERHMILIRGYDPGKNELITNDPGTRQGKGYRYDLSHFWQSIRDYPTGDHVPITQIEKTMIVVEKEN